MTATCSIPASITSCIWRAARLTLYRGGYTSFARQRAEKQMLLQKSAAKQESERRHLQSFVDRFRAKATKARQAQSRLKRLEKLQPIVTITDEQTLPFDLPSPEKLLSPPLIALDGAAAGYDEKPVLDRMNLSILPDDRIALLGANGNGKSTFCKLIGGRLPPDEGRDGGLVEDEGRLLCPAPARRVASAGEPRGACGRAHARCAGGEDTCPRGPVRLSRQQGRYAGRETLRRREGAAVDGARGV